MTDVVAPWMLGVVFGVALQRARLGRYETIVNVFRFVDLTVIKFLVSALMVSMGLIQAMVSLGFSEGAPIAQTFALGNLVGGLLFGVGMALVGFCPGTVAAGAGEGRLDNLIPGVLGLYVGAVLFGWTYPRFFPALSRVGNFGAVTAAQSLHVSPWLLVALFWVCGLWLFYALERRAPSRAAAPPSTLLRP